MRLESVTITGADDSVSDHRALFALYGEFPFVEWGLLASKSQQGTPRFPTIGWIKTLVAENCRAGRLVHSTRGLMPLSLHLCGEYARDLLQGGELARQELDEILYGFHRVQLNASGLWTTVDIDRVLQAIRTWPEVEWILQAGKDAVDTTAAERLALLLNSAGLHSALLLDASGGRGVRPSGWPACRSVRCGYAGGLGPDTLTTELPRIAAKVPFGHAWIDMESGVRSRANLAYTTDPTVLDLGKVRQCLELAEMYVDPLLRSSGRKQPFLGTSILSE